MKIQEQVYNALQAKLSRLCRSEYAAHKEKHKNRRSIPPITYSSEVDRMIQLSREILDYSDAEAEAAMAEITSGGIHYAVLKGI